MASRIRTDPPDEGTMMSEQTVYGAVTESMHQAARQGAHPPPAQVEGRRPQVGDADGLRLLHRRGLRRGADPGASGRRLRRQRGLRLRHHRAGDHRRADPAGPGRGAWCTARAGGGRPAVRQLRGWPGTSPCDGDAVPQGGRRARREAGGRRTRGRTDRRVERRRHPGDGAHRLHPAERERSRRVPRPGPRRRRRADGPRRDRGAGGRGVRRGDGDGARRAGHPDHRQADDSHRRNRRGTRTATHRCSSGRTWPA